MIQKADLDKNGSAQAAILSAMLGCLALALANLGTEASEAFKNIAQAIGKLWMPGAQGIGPYSGKETIALAVWLLSWLILHRVLRNKEWPNQIILTLFLTGIACATTLVWPPVFHFLTHRG